MSELRVGGAESMSIALANALALDGIDVHFASASGPLRDIVLLNSAASLIIAGRTEKLRDGIDLAAQSIDRGAARQVLDRLVAATNDGAGHG